MAYERAPAATTVSGPFNVQHIPKVRNIAQPAASTSISTSSGTGPATAAGGSPGASRKMTTTTTTTTPSSVVFMANAILVCTLAFRAEYNNELTCTPGDVFKLVDTTITNGWVLVQSLSSGRKGWVPKDNVKILDLHNSSGNGSIPKTAVREKVREPEKEKEKEKEKTPDPDKLMTPSMSSSSSCLSSNSILDFYSSQMTPCSSSLSSHTPPLRIPAKTPDPEAVDGGSNELTRTYASVFAHSMYFLESSASSSYWYRLDLVSAQNSNQKIHLCRYYTDILVLAKYLSSQADSFNTEATLPLLPEAFALGKSSSADDSFATHISNVDGYLQQLFAILGSQPEHSPLVATFLKFCQPADTDFEHYVPLDDDQVLQILKPQGETDKDIELVLKGEEEKRQNDLGKLHNHHSNDSNQTVTVTVANESGDFLFTAPAPKLHKSYSSTSLSSKNSSNTTISSPSSQGSTIFVKIKIIYKDEFSLIKLSGDELTFTNVFNAVSEKLKGLCRFTMAYRNDRGVFILLRDDNGLKKALLINNRKIIVKVI